MGRKTSTDITESSLDPVECRDLTQRRPLDWFGGSVTPRPSQVPPRRKPETRRRCVGCFDYYAGLIAGLLIAGPRAPAFSIRRIGSCRTPGLRRCFIPASGPSACFRSRGCHRSQPGTTSEYCRFFSLPTIITRSSNIVAPDIAINTILGASGNFRYLAYPSSNTQYYFMGGRFAEHRAARGSFYSTGRDRDKWWSFEGRLFFEKDPTERFYGLGNELGSRR